jgi:hypothetical protein
MVCNRLYFGRPRRWLTSRRGNTRSPCPHDAPGDLKPWLSGQQLRSPTPPHKTSFASHQLRGPGEACQTCSGNAGLATARRCRNRHTLAERGEPCRANARVTATRPRVKRAFPYHDSRPRVGKVENPMTHEHYDISLHGEGLPLRHPGDHQVEGRAPDAHPHLMIT